MDSIKGLIPEIYYDMIARVAPGVPLVAILVSPSLEDLEKISNAVSFILLIGLGYMAGHLLTAVSTFINLFFWNKLILKAFQKNFTLTHEFKKFGTLRVFSVVYQRIDWAASKSASAGAIMKKMEAGAALSDNLLSAWIIVLLYQAFGGPIRWLDNLQSGNFFIPAAVTTVLISSVLIRRAALIVRQDRLLTLLNYPGDAG